MTRGLLALTLLALAAPPALADATVDDASAAAWGLLGSLVADVRRTLGLDEAPAPEESEDEAGAEAPAEEADADDAPRRDAPPTFVNDPFEGGVSDAPPLVLRPVRDLAKSAPVAGGLVGDLDALLFGADAAAPAPGAGAARPAGLAVASAAPAPSAGASGAAFAALAVAGAAGAAAGAAAAFGPALAEKARRLAAFVGIALYTRLHRQSLLDHEVRDRIYAAVRDRPGLTLQEIAEAGGVGRTATAYHLRVLERERLVASRRDGRVRRFHLNGHALDAPARLAALGHPTGRALADLVAAEPGHDQSALAARLGVGASLAHWHLKRLEAAGVLRKVRDGRHVRYFPA